MGKTKFGRDLNALLKGTEVKPTLDVMKAIDFSRTTLAGRRMRRANALEHTKPRTNAQREAKKLREMEKSATRRREMKRSEVRERANKRLESETAAMLRERRALAARSLKEIAAEEAAARNAYFTKHVRTHGSSRPVWLAALAGLPSGTPAQAANSVRAVRLMNRRMAPPRSARTPKAIAMHRKTHAKAIRKASRNPRVAVPALANIGGANSSSSGSGSGSRNAYSWSTDSTVNTSRGVRARSRDSVPRTGELDWIDDVDDTADSAAIAYGRDYAHYLTNQTLERPPSPPFLARPPSPPSHAFLQNRALQNRVTRKRKRSRCARKRPASRRR